MVFTSKTLIPGKEPIGRNKDGSYIYDGVQTQNMSVMPSRGTYDTTKQMSVAPKPIYTPPTPLPMVKSPLGFNIMPAVNKEVAQKMQAPVNDVLGLASVDKTTPHYLKIKEHVSRLQQKGRIDLTDEQSAYIKRFKAKYPDYANIPDVNLYVKNIQADPKIFEKYGNIGEKSFLGRIVGLPLAMAKTGSDAIMEAQDVFQERQKTLNTGGNLGLTNLLASASAGRALGTGVLGMAGDILNVASPLINPETGVTSVTEGLTRDLGTMVEKVPEEYRQQISDLITKYPKITATLGTTFDLSNLIPFLGALGKAKSVGQVDDIIRQVKTSTSQTVVPGEILPGLRTAGKNIQRTVTPDVISKDVATLRAERLRQGLETQNNNLKTVGNAFRNNTKKLDTGEIVTPIDTFEKYGITPDIDEKAIRMGDFTTTREGGLGKIQDNVELIGDEIDSILVSTGKKLKTDDYRARAIEAAKKSPELKQSGKVQSTIDKINTRFDDYKQSYGDEIDIFEVNNIRKTANKDWSPDTQDVSSIVGDVGRDIVYNATDDMAVKKLLREQGNLLAARKYAQVLNGTKIRGGRLGDYFAGGTGAVVGALAGTMLPIPVIGPAIGAGVGQQVGTKLSKLFSATQFNSPMAELKGLFKSEGVGLPKGKVKPQIKASILDRLPKAKSTPPTSSNLPSQTSEVSSIQKLLQEPQKPQKTPGKSSVLNQLSKGKEKSAGKKVNNPIIQKLGKKQETPKTPQVEGKTDEYFYHGTGPLAFEQIQKEGIKPQRRGVSSFSKTEEYSRNWAYPEATGIKGAMLRVKKSYMEGKLFNTKKPRPKTDELYEVLTKETIPPEALEVLKDGKWQPLKPNTPTPKEGGVKKSSLPMSDKGAVKYSEPMDSLASEARKYKSAEEFVKAQGEPLYHGTNADFEQFSVKGGKRSTVLAEENVESQGSFFTDNKDVAEIYSKTREGGKPRVIEAFVPMESTLDISNLRNAPKLLDDILRLGKEEGIYVSNIEDYWQLLDNKKIADFIKSKGYDSVKISEIDRELGEHFSYFSLYPEKIKTKQQLTEIYNKANK